MPGTASTQAPERAAASLVASPDNELVRRLRRARRGREPNSMLLEGPRVVAEAVRCGVRLEVLALREDLDAELDLERAAERMVRLGPRAFASVSETVAPQGVLALAARPRARIADALAAARGAGWPLVVLDGVQDPGNVGTVCRSAAAAGAPALAVLGGGADPFGAKAVRASAGHVFRLTVAAGEWEDLAGLGGYGAAAAGGVSPAEADLAGAPLLALGGEVRGLRNPALERVTIDMAPGVESLNVAAAAAVLLFEVRRRLSA